jgi:endonuclease YncB( thermonuclease family)
MAFSQEQLTGHLDGIRIALASTSISEYDRKFLQDMQVKLCRFGARTQLSQRQYQRLTRLTGAGRSRAIAQHPYSKRHQRSLRKQSWRQVLGSIAFAVSVVGVAAFHATERFPEYVGPIVTLTATEAITGRVTHVRDGDTIEVAGIPIRFGSLDCAEGDTSEGQRATAKMRGLVVGERLTCHLNGRTSYDRKIGSCQLRDGRDLAAVMIREGYCGRYW